ALRALAIDEGAPEAHVSLADILYQYDADWPGAEREFRRAISLAPSGAAAHHWYSNYLSAAGRFPESMSEIETARSLDPFNPVIANDLALASYWAGRIVSAFPAAFVRVALDEREAALSGLEKALEEKEGRLVYLKVERAFDALRSEPRFAALVRRLGIPG